MATLLTIENLSKSYGPRVIFQDANLAIQEKQKIGVIGRNGAGKSTLFRMVVGEEEHDFGSVAIQAITRLGYLKQHEEINPEDTTLQYLERVTGKEAWQCAKIAGKFELKGDLLSAKILALSGGYRMRVKLTEMLLLDPNLFLLDEPTNYLDVHTQLLLEKFLQTYNGAFLIISHDREFLKRTCQQTLEVENGKLFLHPRPIDEYLEYKREQLVFAQNYNKKIETEQKHLQAFVDRFRYKASKARQAQSKLKAIERLEKIEIDDPLANVRITIPGVESKKGLSLRTKDLTVGYGEKIISSSITFDIDRGERVAILGDNGQGKTTLLKTLSGTIPALAGMYRWAHDASIAYYAQHVPSELNPTDKVWGYLRTKADLDIHDQEVLRMASNFLFRDDDLKKEVSMLSGGERARLCLAGILLSKNNILLLDEPTNHLDFETVEALGRALEGFAGTILFISHNRTFVNSLATIIIEVKDGKAYRYPGTYEEYIYKLEQQVADESGSTSTEVSAATTVASPPQSVDQIKTNKKKLRKLEEEVAELERDKNRLLKKQAKNPTKFLAEDYARLGEMIKTLEEKENDWLAIQSLVEELKNS